jgi:glycosyltransferase involved in cell wall biosynthesis
MRILFTAGAVYLPQTIGGSQVEAHDLCRSLMRRGHKVAVLARFVRDGFFSWRCTLQKKLLRRKVSRDAGLGYPVWRAWHPWEEIQYVCKRESPDLIVMMAGDPVRMALAAKHTRIPVFIELQDTEFRSAVGTFHDLGADISCTANSRFTAQKYRNAFGFNPTVINPFINPENYKTKTTRRNVTFINPHPSKGRDIALGIARLCPDIPFTFVEAWQLSAEQRRELLENLALLENVTLIPRQTDMRNVYGKCKILLVPTVIEEAYGRVATEAQLSGIPVIASTRGGLPEAVGPGGILLDPDRPIADWAAAVRKLWQDQAHYAELSAAALAYAERREMTFDYQIAAWEQAFLAASNATRDRGDERNFVDGK